MGVSFLPQKSCSVRFFSSGERSALCHTNQSTRLRTRHCTCAHAIHVKGINVASEQIRQIYFRARTCVNCAQMCSLEIHTNRKLSQTFNPIDVSSENTEPAPITAFTSLPLKKIKNNTTTFLFFPVNSQVTTTRSADYLSNQAAGLKRGVVWVDPILWASEGSPRKGGFFPPTATGLADRTKRRARDDFLRQAEEVEPTFFPSCGWSACQVWDGRMVQLKFMWLLRKCNHTLCFLHVLFYKFACWAWLPYI